MPPTTPGPGPDPRDPRADAEQLLAEARQRARRLRDELARHEAELTQSQLPAAGDGARAVKKAAAAVDRLLSRLGPG